MIQTVTAIESMARPTSKLQHSELVTYLLKFLPKISDVAQPIRELTFVNAKLIWAK